MAGARRRSGTPRRVLVLAVLAAAFVASCGTGASEDEGTGGDAAAEGQGAPESSPGEAQEETQSFPSLPEPTTLTVAAQGGLQGFTSGIWVGVADELGYFDDANIEPDLVTVTTGADAINGMQAGDINVSLIGPEGYVAADAGADVISVGAMTDTSTFFFLAAEHIQSWDDTGGATVGVSSLDAIPAVVLSRAAAAAGFDAETDYDRIVIGGSPQNASALSAGQIDMGPMTMPHAFRMESDGFTNLGQGPEGHEAEPISTLEIVTTRSWADDHGDELRAFLAAIDRAVDYARDEGHRDDFVTLAAELSERTEEEVEATFDYYFWSSPAPDMLFPEGLRHHEDAFTTTLAAYQELGAISEDTSVTEETYFDMSYLPE